MGLCWNFVSVYENSRIGDIWQALNRPNSTISADSAPLSRPIAQLVILARPESDLGRFGIGQNGRKWPFGWTERFPKSNLSRFWGRRRRRLSWSFWLGWFLWWHSTGRSTRIRPMSFCCSLKKISLSRKVFCQILCYSYIVYRHRFISALCCPTS